MSETKEFIVLDNDNDFVSVGLASKADAIEAARKRLANGGKYTPYTIYESVAVVKPASPPLSVIDI